jgi:hypothetical protein
VGGATQGSKDVAGQALLVDPDQHLGPARRRAVGGSRVRARGSGVPAGARSHLPRVLTPSRPPAWFPTEGRGRRSRPPRPHPRARRSTGRGRL